MATISRRAEESILIPKTSPIISKPIPVPFHKALSLSGDGSVLGGMCARASNKYGASAALLHNYEIEGILGEGGSGVVVSARRKQDCRNVAVKFIRKSALSITHWKRDRTSNTTIPLEIFLLKRISHPNIVEFIDTIEDDQFFYLVMELVGSPKGDSPDIFKSPEYVRKNSSDLFEFINMADNEKISEDIIAKIFYQVCDAIQYLHSNGYVHRDIKDENIIVNVNEDYEAKLVDFGAADKIPQNQREYFTSFRGTPRYTPPEIFKSPVHRGPEVDIWCLGILLYTLSYSQNPFLTKDDILNNRISSPPCIRSHNLTDLLKKILQSDPSCRPSIVEIKSHPFLQGFNSK